MLEILFWASLATLGYVYLGFFLLLVLLSKFFSRPVQQKNIYPSVSIVISAYNEENHILQKLDNCYELDYPKELIEIIVVSDGSTDKTNALLMKVSDPAIKVYCLPEQKGKAYCQNLGVSKSKNEVLFFTDATIMHPPNALKILLKNLHDPSVGCVTGKPVFRRDEGLTSKGLGKRDTYELHLRKMLGQVNSLFGAQDCIYVIPRSLYCPVREDLDSGFVGPLKVLEKGYRTVYEPEALAYVERPVPNLTSEFIRRSRIVLRGMRGLLHMRQLMNPFRHGFLAVALISTRFLRWLTPVFLLLLFGSNLFLLESAFYTGMFFIQVGFYGTALLAFFLDQKGYKPGFVFAIPLYFCMIAGSALVGLTRLLNGETGQVWQTRR